MLVQKRNNYILSEIKTKLSWLAYTNIIVALSAAASLYTAFIFMNVDVYWPSLLMLFLITFSIYNIDRCSDKKLDKLNHPERQNFLSYRKYLLHISIASYAAALAIAGSTELRLLLLIPLASALLYKYAGLKRIYLMKNITVALAWAITITSIPVVSGSSIPIELAFAFFSFFLMRAFVNAVAYDVKDMRGDARFSIRTLPVKIGIPKTKAVLYTLTIIAGLLAVYYGFIFSSMSIYFISTITAYTIFYIYRIGVTEIKFLSDFAMDGEFIIMGFLACLGCMFPQITA